MNNHNGGIRHTRIAVVDYGMGNLFSVIHACSAAGLYAWSTHSTEEILKADAVILPGVGSFGDAMLNLTKSGLDNVLREVVVSGTPFMGICLGMQLMMTESEEFGYHKGLGIIDGQVVKLKTSTDGIRNLKVPQVGWNKIHDPVVDNIDSEWNAEILSGIPKGSYMYFVHSYVAVPRDDSLITSFTDYGVNNFCSSLKNLNVFGCQFHPERSGENGIKMYQNLRELVDSQ